VNVAQLGGGVGAHYWAGKEFRREKALRGARRRRALRPSPRGAYQSALLVLLLLTSAATFWKNRALEKELNVPRADVHLLDLFAASNVERGGGNQNPIVPPPPDSAGSLLFILHAPDLEEVDPPYDVDLRDAHTGRVLWEQSGLAPRTFDTFNVEMRRRFLPGGAYAFRLFGMGRSGRMLLAIYRFELPGDGSGKPGAAP
jgi:hypothetical protein